MLSRKLRTPWLPRLSAGVPGVPLALDGLVAADSGDALAPGDDGENEVERERRLRCRPPEPAGVERLERGVLGPASAIRPSREVRPLSEGCRGSCERGGGVLPDDAGLEGLSRCVRCFHARNSRRGLSQVEDER